MPHGHHHDSDEITGRHLDWALLRRFLGYLLAYRGAALAALLLLPAVAAAKLVQPYLLMVAIDSYIIPGDIAGLWLIALLFLLALAAESLLTYAQAYAVQWVGQRIMADLRREGFARLLRLPVAYFDRQPSGRLVTRLTSDVENVGELFGAGVVSALGDLLTLAAIVVIMLWINPSLSLVAFAVIPFLLILGLLFRHYIRHANRQVRARLAGLNAFVAERIAGADEVRLFVQEERTLKQFDRLQDDYQRASLRVINWDACLYAGVEALGAVAIAAILWQGGGEVIAGLTSFGVLVAFIEYVQKFFAPLRDLSAKYSVIQASNASLERIFEILDRAPEPGGVGACPEGSGEIRLEGVAFAYDEQAPVLRDISLHLRPGETLALVGDTGSGKTTLARLLLRFYEPTAGRILLDGCELAAMDPAEVRRRIGWVAQEPFLFDGSVHDNLDSERRRDVVELKEILRRTGADAVVARLGGLDAHISERGRNLSAGERQLLCLARALVPDPQWLILDEATSRLDAETEEQIRLGMEAARRGRGALLIAHRLRSVVQADRILVLRRGRIVEQGSHRELLAAAGLYARLWRLQALENGP
ncbi:ABC transporter ATP-binding protein [Geoalkalibacter halelectricus]|uniref:ABC transporter ATP-binding protein/permease n=1 Tax=Geoalkalibacter halelectricus TaxID=2847045 RepID=A0ABY5ZMB8_9BACT|nr:ABC transporter ATP-binding protein [Geoalkalibacter halelectricus]MDO3378400.1 ABC transporter ATP-binding protein/permease [Geoalkalibacter halelectricus]UWZ80280.1 ABC transporter ATP-binding protein/permease [Geoalkalibacter halelectricus]